MISKDNYQLVKKAIKIHNNLKDRTYLIGARIQIVQVKMRIPYYKFYGTM